MAGPVWAIVVAAGSGTRFGGQKQFALLRSRPVLAHSVAAVAAVSDGIVVVLPPDDSSPAIDLLKSVAPNSRLVTVTGRATRAGSVRAGLAAVPEECEVVVVHDAARPLASTSLTLAVVAAVRDGAAGAIPGVRLSDTVKRVDGDRVVETLDRAVLVGVQTPQAFHARVLRIAHGDEPEATDDAGLVEAVGGRIVVVPGEPSNLKVTAPEDLELAEWWLERLESGAAAEGGAVL